MKFIKKQLSHVRYTWYDSQRSLLAFARASLQPTWVRSADAVILIANALRTHGDCSTTPWKLRCELQSYWTGWNIFARWRSTANVTLHFIHHLVYTFHSPSCLGQETAKGPFGVRIKLPPALLSRGGFRGGWGDASPPTSLQSNNFGRKISLYFEKLGSISGCIPPPHQCKANGFGRKITLNFGEDLFFFLETTWFWAEKTFEFPISAKKSLSISVKTFVFFGDHLILGGKNVRISDFGPKITLNFGEDIRIFEGLCLKSPPPKFSRSATAPVYHTRRRLHTVPLIAER